MFDLFRIFLEVLPFLRSIICTNTVPRGYVSTVSHYYVYYFAKHIINRDGYIDFSEFVKIVEASDFGDKLTLQF